MPRYRTIAIGIALLVLLAGCSAPCSVDLEPVTDADLHDLGIDPETVPDEPQVPDAPWFSE
jgi:hypothetical protein